MPWSVNGNILSESTIRFELDRLLKFYSEHLAPEEIRKQLPALRLKAVEQAIGSLLLLEEAGRRNIRIPDSDIAERIQTMTRNAGGKDAFAAILQKQGLTDSQLRDSIRKGRMVDLLVSQITADLPAPTEDEIKAQYDTHTSEYVEPDKVLAQHILIKATPDDPTELAIARSRLEEIRSKVQQGASFSDQAAMHSECPSGKQTGGSLGWIARGMTVPEFEKALFSMKVGELSDIVTTQFGLHLIFKADEEDGGPADFEDVHDKIRDFLQHTRRGAAISALVKTLRANAVLEEVADPE